MDVIRISIARAGLCGQLSRPSHWQFDCLDMDFDFKHGSWLHNLRLIGSCSHVFLLTRLTISLLESYFVSTRWLVVYELSKYLWDLSLVRMNCYSQSFCHNRDHGSSFVNCLFLLYYFKTGHAAAWCHPCLTYAGTTSDSLHLQVME